MITPEHEQQVLLPRGITAEQAERFGVRSILTNEDLPEELRESKYASIGGLLFTWNSPLSGIVHQYRPDNPVANPQGDPVKYLFKSGSTMVLNCLRGSEDDPHSTASPSGPVLLCEGTMQSMAAAIYAPPQFAVYGMSGCWSWRHGDTTVATPDLLVVEERDVIVVLDADAATNLDVYNAGMALTAALEAEGATSVRFARLDGHGKKAGLDDVLGARPVDKRASYLARLLDGAEEKPAKKAPPKRQRSTGTVYSPTPDRPIIAVNGDRHQVINEMTDVLRNRWSGSTLFNYGGILARRNAETIAPVTKPVFADLIAEAALTVTVNSKGEMVPAWPDEPSRDATLSRAERFAPLERISQVPFVRADGSICQSPGYDEPSATFLVLDESMSAIEIPEEPTADDVTSAVKLLCDEWLGDFFAIMPEPEDRANCLALMLTPLIRGLVPLAPMAVVDGLQMGVGKNILADLLMIITHGKAADPLPYGDDEENRKVITANFRAGHDLFVFDEAHVIEGRHLAKSITAVTYTDRILGVSNMIEFPNRVTWVALGNNVSVNGDLSRRVYRIRLAPVGENPQDRDSSQFRHPDIRGWTRAHRHELVAAALTLVRAWFVSEERVENSAGRRFGSFEQWGGMVGGILDNAGIEGFLGSLVEWRSETDFETQWWLAHLSWLRRVFGAEEFTVSDVVLKMKRDGARGAPTVEHPPRLEDHNAGGYNRALGLAYGRVKNRWMQGLRLVKTFESPGHGNRWSVTGSDDGSEGVTPVAPSESKVEPASDIQGDMVDSTLPTRGENSSVYMVPRVYSDFSEGQPDPATHSSTQSPSDDRGYSLYPSYPAIDGADPLQVLLPLATAVQAPSCPDCDRPEELTPSGFWFACRSCTPQTFV